MNGGFWENRAFAQRSKLGFLSERRGYHGTNAEITNREYTPEEVRAAVGISANFLRHSACYDIDARITSGTELGPEAIHEAAARGEVPSEAVPVLMIDYMGPSLDTTIFGITNGVWLFANNPDQWDIVREDPSKIPAAINEILRMEAPIQDFSRYVARDYDLGGVLLPEGSRAISF